MLHAFNLITLNPCVKGADPDKCQLKKYLDGDCTDCLKYGEKTKKYWEEENA